MLKSRFMGWLRLPVPYGNSAPVARVLLLTGGGSWARSLGVSPKGKRGLQSCFPSSLSSAAAELFPHILLFSLLAG